MGGTYPFLTRLWPLGSTCSSGGLHTVCKFLNNCENNWKLWKKHWKHGFFTEINPVLTAYFVSLFTPYKVRFLVFFASCTMPLYFGIMWLESNQEHFSIYCLLKMWIRVHIFTLDPCSYGVSFSPATPSWCHIWLKGNFLWHRWCWSRSCPCSGSCPKDPQIILSCLFSLIHLIYIHKPPVTPLSAPSSTDHYFFFVSLSKCQ